MGAFWLSFSGSYINIAAKYLTDCYHYYFCIIFELRKNIFCVTCVSLVSQDEANTIYFLVMPCKATCFVWCVGGGPRVVVSTAAFHARVRGSVPSLGGLKETKMFLPHPRVKVSNVGSLRDREVACSASDRQGSNFESCVWRTVSSQSSHHPQEVLLAQFSLYVHKGGLKPDSFHLFGVNGSRVCVMV